MDKKEELIKMISNIEKDGVLDYIHTFVKEFLKIWG